MMMENLLALVSLAQNLYGKWLFQRLLYAVAVGVSLTILTSIMAAAMLAGGFYAAYLALLHAGFDPGSAILMVGAAGIGVTALLALFTVRYFLRLSAMPRKLLQKKIPPLSEANDVLDAFLDGFMEPQRK